MFARNSKPVCETDRLILRLPQHNDFRAWVDLRSDSRDFLSPWESAQYILPGDEKKAEAK